MKILYSLLLASMPFTAPSLMAADGDVSVRLNCGGDVPQCVGHIYVNRTETPATNGTLCCRAGDVVYIEFNDNYKYEAINIGGKPIDMAGFHMAHTFVAEGDTDIEVVARPYAEVRCNIGIDNPEAVNLYHSYSYYGDDVELTTGVNTLTLAEDDAMLTVEHVPGYEIVRITDTEGNEYHNLSRIDITDGMNLTFVTARCAD